MAFGQHFLSSQDVVEHEVILANPKEKTVVEFGAGRGTIIEALLKHNPKKIYAIENDHYYVDLLKEKFAGDDRVVVIEADIRTVEPPKSDVFIANIPYYLTKRFLERMPFFDTKAGVMIVQKEVGKKLCAQPGDANYRFVSALTQTFFRVTWIRTVGKGCFTPVPKVDSAMVLVKRNQKPAEEEYVEFLRGLFNHKNKVIPSVGKRVRHLNPDELWWLYENRD